MGSNKGAVAEARSRRSRWGSLAVAGAIGLTALVGCGGSSDGSDADSSASADTKITIATVAPAALLTIPAYAEAHGIFAKHHLDVTVTELPSNAIYAAFASGKAQFATMPSPQPEIGQLQGVDLKWIANWANDTPVEIVGGPGIKSVADLAGRKIATTAPGTVTDIFPRVALQKAGKSGSSATMVPVGQVSTMLSSFISGSADAIATAPPVVQAALNGRAGSTVIEKMSDLLHWPSGGLAAYMPYAQDHPDVANELVAAMSEAVQQWLKDPAGAKRVIADQTDVTDEQAAVAYDSVKPIVAAALGNELVPSVQSEKQVLETLAETGNDDAKSADPADFVDTSFAQALQK